MFQSTTTKRIVVGVGVIASMLLLRAPAFAEPPVNVKAGKFETATEKKALKALRMKGGYKGDADSKALAEKLNKAARVTDQIAFKADDKANALTHVSRSDPSAHMKIDKTTGDFSYSKGLKNYANDKATTGLVSEDRAPDAARKFLTDLGLMPEKQDELVVRHIGGLRQQDSQDGKAGPVLDKLVTVHFGRKIDGVDVGGPGSKIIVDLGANGELVAIQRRWIEVTEEGKGAGDFKAQAEVVSDLRRRLVTDGAKAKRIDANAPTFGWFDDGKGNIEPAYFFDADITYDSVDAEGKPVQEKEKHHGAVPALKNSKADFAQLEKAGKQPARAASAPAQDKPSQKD